MKDDQEEAFEKLLSAQLTRTVDFVKFAETKNAALLTFTSAWILGSISLVTGTASLPFGYDKAFLFALPLFGLAGITCILSFLPKLLGDFHEPENDTKSLLYWEHIAEVPVRDFAVQAEQRYKPGANQSCTKGYLEDLSVQISVNARIAQRKFRSFKLAARFTLLAFLVLVLPPLWIAARFLRLFQLTD